MINTLIQYGADGEFVTIGQTSNSAQAYKLFNSAIRFMRNRNGEPRGMFSRHAIRIEWRTMADENADILSGKLLSCYPLDSVETLIATEN